MITRMRRRLFSVRHNYLNPIDRQRARVLLLVNWTIALAMAAWLIVGIVPVLAAGNQIPLQSLIALALTLTFNIVIYRQIQTGGLRTAIWLFVGILAFNIILLTVFWQPGGKISLSGAFVIAMVLPMVAGGVLLSRRGMILVALVLLAAVIYAAIGQSQNNDPYTIVPSQAAFFDIPIIIITLGLVLLFLLVFAGNLERIANDSLSDIQQRQWITELGIELGTVTDESQVLARALEVVRDRFQYIFAQFYLTGGEGRFNRTMRYGSSQLEEVAQESLNLSDSNVIKEAAQQKKLKLTSADDVLAHRSHLLPSANYGIAVPIQRQNEVLGVLDVQSAGQVGFSQNEVQALTLLADQVSTALIHARTVNDLQRNLVEQEAANNRLEAQVADYIRRERRGISGAWTQYLEGRGTTIIGYNLEPDSAPSPVPARDVPETLQATLKSGQLHVESAGDEQIVNVPITFRDQILGAMSFALPKDQRLTEREIEMARIVAERLALALENTRLFEQSQAQALRERKASEVSSLLIGATDVYSVLNLAAQNFNEALGAVHTRIYIQPGVFSEPLAETREEEIR